MFAAEKFTNISDDRKKTNYERRFTRDKRRRLNYLSRMIHGRAGKR